jgi:hypothetical protein
VNDEGNRTEVIASLAALEVLDTITKAGWAQPSIFPQLDGEVRMEWLTDHSHTVLTVDNDNHFWAFHLNVETDEEASDEPVDPKNAVAFLGRFIK